MAQQRADQSPLEQQRARYRDNKATQRRRQHEKIEHLEQKVLALNQSLRHRKIALEELKTKINFSLLSQALNTSDISTHTKGSSKEIVTQFGELFKLGASQTVFWAKYARVGMNVGFLTQLKRFVECYHHTFHLADFQLHRVNTQDTIRFDGVVRMVLTRIAVEHLYGNQRQYLERFIGQLLKIPIVIDFYFDSNNCIEKVDWEWDWIRGFLPILSLEKIGIILINSKGEGQPEFQLRIPGTRST